MSQQDISKEFQARRAHIRKEMGGPHRLERIRARNGWTIRDRIDTLFDPDSFTEIGTFARSSRPEDKDDTPGDGKIGGIGHVDGRPVCVVGDDVTVRHGVPGEERALDARRPRRRG